MDHRLLLLCVSETPARVAARGALPILRRCVCSLSRRAHGMIVEKYEYCSVEDGAPFSMWTLSRFGGSIASGSEETENCMTTFH